MRSIWVECVTHPAVRDALNSMFRALRKKSPGDWSGWHKLPMKGAQLSSNVMTQIDNELLKLWEALKEKDRDLWSLNCLVNTSIEAVAKLGGACGREGE